MSITTDRAVFLDFDGVLFDTIREVYAVSMIALDSSTNIKDINFDSKHFEKFSKLRYLVGPAWNYYYVMQAINKEPLDSSRDLEIEYKSLLDQTLLGEYGPFEKKFFLARQYLREKEHKYWLSMICTYNIVDDLRSILSQFKEQFFLVTTRDKDSVLDLLSLNNLDIPESNIFTKKEYALNNSKANIIQDLIKKYKIEESLFIDDLEEHILACGEIENLSTLQAKWGYVVPEKKEDNSAFLLKELERFIHGENVRA